MSDFSSALKRYLMRPLVFVLVFIAIVTGTMSPSAFSERSPESSFRSATEGFQYEFPRDHGSHDEFRTEWWYYTGHLQTRDGGRFGFELTFFRRAMPPQEVKTQPSRWSLSQVYLAHFAVTDVDGARFLFAEKLSRAGLGKAGAEGNRLHVWIDNWRAESFGDDGAQILEARDGQLALSLSVTPVKPPVIHGRNGISRKGGGAGQASHYYSYTRLETRGMLTIDSRPLAVTGTAWMDHEFGSADLGAEVVGWDWFSVQLEDKSELMLYRMRRADGSSDPVSSGTVIFPDGRSRYLSLDDMLIEATASWTSQASRARYPSAWRIAIPSLALDLKLVPLVEGQELRTSRSTQVTYWEGAVSTSGTKQGQPVKGQGYVELTGYAERFIQRL
jgi:predicted secreted hydrolase